MGKSMTPLDMQAIMKWSELVPLGDETEPSPSSSAITPSIPSALLPDDVRVTIPALDALARAVGVGPAEARHAIMALQAEMQRATGNGELPDVLDALPMRHQFVNGVYAREMVILAGTLIIGMIHKHAHFNFVMSGRILVLSEDGAKEVCGPCYFESKAGIKRVGIALEDTVWVTVHPTSATTVEDAEPECVVDTYEEFAAFRAALLPDPQTGEFGR